MKLTIIGAASPRFPLLYRSILRKNVPVAELVLHDADTHRLKLIVDRLLPEIRVGLDSGPEVRIAEDFEDAVDSADYIFSSIRVGGQQARMLDESIPLRYGHLGQETIGIGGFSLALRTIPVVVEQARIIQRKAPEAWIINFTNPAGIVTQALRRLTGHRRIVGICDAPEVITRMVCVLYDVPFEDVEIRYFGMNHLGWAYSIRVHGREVLDEIIDERLEDFIREEPFYAGLVEHIRSVRLIPNEYLFYYVNPEEVADNQQRSGVGRAKQIRQLDDRLYEELHSDIRPALESFNAYMTDRESGYMTGETGYERSIDAFDLLNQNKDWGYDAVALAVLDSLSGRSKRPVILNTRNDGFYPAFGPEDIVEISTILQDGGFEPVDSAPMLPPEANKLLTGMKKYENALIEAVGRQDWKATVRALEHHPLVTAEAARAAAADIRNALADRLGYFGID